MKKSNLPVIALAAMLAVATIGAVISVIVTAFGSSSHPVSPEERYISVLDESKVRYGSEHSALDLAAAICSAMEAGVTRQMAVDVGTEYLTTRESRIVVDAAVENFCPGADAPLRG